MSNTFWDRASNIALVAMCGLMGLLVAHHQWSTSSSAVVQPSPVKRGVVLDALRTAEVERFQATVVVSVRSTCRYCTDSMGFYRRLSESCRQNGQRCQTVIVSMESVETTEAYLASHNVKPDRVLTLQDAVFAANGTPMMLVLDSKAAVLDGWLGRLSQSREQTVQDVLARVTGTAGRSWWSLFGG